MKKRGGRGLPLATPSAAGGEEGWPAPIPHPSPRGLEEEQQPRQQLAARTCSSSGAASPSPPAGTCCAPFHVPLISPFSVSESAAGGCPLRPGEAAVQNLPHPPAAALLLPTSPEPSRALRVASWGWLGCASSTRPEPLSEDSSAVSTAASPRTSALPLKRRCAKSEAFPTKVRVGCAPLPRPLPVYRRG